MTQDLLQLWKAVLGEMEVTISSPEFRTWFSNSQIIEQKENTFTIGVSNNFAKERMRKKYEKQIVKILEKITKTKDILLDFQISHKGGITQTSAPSSRPKTPTNAPSRKGKPTETATLSLDIAQTNLNPRYTFESFIVGNGNRLAHAACKAVSENPGNAYNPLFLYSGVGLGKTHLTQSIGMAVLKRFPGKKVFYVTTEQFTNELVGSIRNQSSQDFRKKYRKNDVLLIDDIQFIAGKERTQEEFFHTFNALREANRQVVLTSDRPPKEILTLEERLRSRFESGLIVDIAPPDYETRLAILRFKTESAQLDIPGDVLEFIARSITNNIRELEGALNSILAKSQLEEIPITLSSAQEVLGKTLGFRKKIKADDIIKAGLDFYGLTSSELKSKRRDKRVSLPRQIIMYLLRKENQLPFEQIGDILGGRDHTTVMHACEKIDKAVSNDERVENEINLIREKMYMKK